MKKILSSMTGWIIRFLYLQLFLTLISLPIIIKWGIPISLMTFVGNLIFSPFLTIFLLLSSLVFVCVLLHIPCGFLASILDKITYLWLLIIKSISVMPIGMPDISWCLHFLLILLVLLIIHAKRLGLYQAIISLILVGTLFYTACIWWNKSSLAVKQFAVEKASIINDEECIIIIDKGSFYRHRSYASWLEYTLMPEVIKKMGSTSIDHFIVPCLNARVLRALKQSLPKLRIHHLYIPAWHGRTPDYLFRAYKELKDCAKANDCTLICVGNYAKKINEHYHLISTGYQLKEQYSFAQLKLIQS